MIKKILTYKKIILFFLVLVAFFLRYLYIKNGAILFGYDQGRDAFLVEEILRGDIKILGPPTSGIPGFFHGVLYYYYILPGYLLAKGPFGAVLWLALINSLVVLLVYLVAKIFSKSETVSLVAAFLFAISYEASQYGTWLSNPTMGVWFVPLIYLGVYLWMTKRKSKYLFLSFFSLGCAIQSNLALAYHLVPVFFWLWKIRERMSFKKYLVSFSALLLSTSSLILSEVKFGFKGLAGLSHLFVEETATTRYIKFGEFLVQFLNDFGDMMANNLFPTRAGLGGLLGFVFIFYLFYGWYRDKRRNVLDGRMVLLTWVFSYLMMAPFGGLNTPHISVGLGIAVIIITAWVLVDLSKKYSSLVLLIIFLIVFSNFVMIDNKKDQGQVIFAIQKGMILKNQLGVIDYTYSQARGNDFSINTLTSPLFINSTWSYLYNWYGKNVYSYLPKWRGRDQVGSLGNNLLNAKDETNLHFFIMEDLSGIPEKYLVWGLGEEDSRSKLIEEKYFSTIRVQKRQINLTDEK